MSFDNRRKQVMSCFERAPLGGMKAALAGRESVTSQRALLRLGMLWAGRMRLGSSGIFVGILLVLVHAAAACEFGPVPDRATGIVCRMTKPAALLCKCPPCGTAFSPSVRR